VWIVPQGNGHIRLLPCRTMRRTRHRCPESPSCTGQRSSSDARPGGDRVQELRRVAVGDPLLRCGDRPGSPPPTFHDPPIDQRSQVWIQAHGVGVITPGSQGVSARRL
jgi:hypothetical protein